ncbi:MAG: hypothetical protein U0800_07860 [Isosphaeraceae bacterium]
MARKTAETKSGVQAASSPEKPAQTSIINLKGTDEYRDWLRAQSKRTHIPAASIVRLGLALWAEKNGASEPPEK